MKLYIYDTESMEVLAIINGESNEDCEKRAEDANWYPGDDIAWTYSPAFGFEDGLVENKEIEETTMKRMSEVKACGTCPLNPCTDKQYTGCCFVGNHPYTAHPCQKCEHEFCYECSAGFWRGMAENGHDLTKCPFCGHTQEA